MGHLLVSDSRSMEIVTLINDRSAIYKRRNQKRLTKCFETHDECLIFIIRKNNKRYRPSHIY